MLENFASIYVPVTKGRKFTDSFFQPEILMISTDGLRNAFLSDEAFAEKLLEIAQAFRKGDGKNFVRNSRKWLEERSMYGVTQDDIAFSLCSKYSVKLKQTQRAKKSKTDA